MRGAEPGWSQRRNFGIAMLVLAAAMPWSATGAQAQSSLLHSNSTRKKHE
jgi:hypothetical protein